MVLVLALALALALVALAQALPRLMPLARMPRARQAGSYAHAVSQWQKPLQQRQSLARLCRAELALLPLALNL